MREKLPASAARSCPGIISLSHPRRAVCHEKSTSEILIVALAPMACRARGSFRASGCRTRMFRLPQRRHQKRGSRLAGKPPCPASPQKSPNPIGVDGSFRYRARLSFHTPARTRAWRHSLTVKPSDVNVIYIYTARRFNAMGLLFCILGLVWWFPIGLVILAAFVISRPSGLGTARSSLGASRAAVGVQLGADGKAGCQTDHATGAAAAPQVGSSKHPVAVKRLTITAPRHCAVSKTSNATSRNFYSDSAPPRIAPN